MNDAVVGSVTAPSGISFQSGMATASGSGEVNLVDAVMNLGAAKKAKK